MAKLTKPTKSLSAEIKKVEITLNMSEQAYSELAEQKLELLKALNDNKLTDKINGIIYLIDDIQDQTLKGDYFSENIVFPLFSSA